MLDTKTKTLSWACDSRSPWTVTYMRVAGAGSLQRVCVCVCMHVCVCTHACVCVGGREPFTGGWRRGAVNSTVKRPGRRRTRSVVSKALLFWKPAFEQRVHVAGDFSF